MEDDALDHIAQGAQGDARAALNALEAASLIASTGEGVLDLNAAEEALQRRALPYDKSGDWHYDVISAFIKSMRGSDPDAAVYWLVRMLEAGEDPRFLARRMVIFASEDVGNADPTALQVAVGGSSSARVRRTAGGQIQPGAVGRLPRSRPEVERIGEGPLGRRGR